MYNLQQVDVFTILGIISITTPERVVGVVVYEVITLVPLTRHHVWAFGPTYSFGQTTLGEPPRGSNKVTRSTAPLRRRSERRVLCRLRG